jgi:hypothetical protein
MKHIILIVIILFAWDAASQTKQPDFPQECMQVYNEILNVASTYQTNFPESYNTSDYSGTSLNVISEYTRLQIGFSSGNKEALEEFERYEGRIFMDLVIIESKDSFCIACLRKINFPYLYDMFHACMKLTRHYIQQNQPDSALYYLDLAANKYKYIQTCGVAGNDREISIAWNYLKISDQHGNLYKALPRIMTHVLENDLWQSGPMADSLLSILTKHNLRSQLKNDLEHSFNNIKEYRHKGGHISKYIQLYGEKIFVLHVKQFRAVDMDDIAHLKKYSIYRLL